MQHRFCSLLYCIIDVLGHCNVFLRGSSTFPALCHLPDAQTRGPAAPLMCDFRKNLWLLVVEIDRNNIILRPGASTIADVHWIVLRFVRCESSRSTGFWITISQPFERMPQLITHYSKAFQSFENIPKHFRAFRSNTLLQTLTATVPAPPK